MLLQAVQTQIALAADMEALIRRVNSSPKYRKQTATLQGKLDAAKKSLMRYNGLYDSLYQSYVDQLMTEQEYMTLKRELLLSLVITHLFQPAADRVVPSFVAGIHAVHPILTFTAAGPSALFISGAARILPLMAGLCIGGGIVCYQLHASTASALAGITLLAIGLYTGTLQISLWKSGTIALTVCAVFACINSLSRAISAAIALHMQLPQDEPWFCLAA